MNYEKFLLKHFKSVAILELLFFFYDNRPRSFSAVKASLELRSSESAVRKHIQDLVGRNFLKAQLQEEEYAYHSSAEWDSLINELFDQYKIRPAYIIRLIYESPNQKLEGFSNAFKLKK